MLERGRERDMIIVRMETQNHTVSIPSPPPSTDCRCLPNKQSGERTQWGSAFLFDKTEIPCVNTVRHRGVRLPRRERIGHRIVIENMGIRFACTAKMKQRGIICLSLSLFSKINKRIIHRFLAFEIFLSKNMIIRLLL